MGGLVSLFRGGSPDKSRKMQIMKLLLKFHFNQLITNSYSVLTAASYSRLSLLIIHQINHSITEASVDDESRGGGIRYVDTKGNEAILVAFFFIFSYISGLSIVRYFSKLALNGEEMFGISLHFMIHTLGEMCAFALKDLVVYVLFAYVYSHGDKICYLYMFLWTTLLVLVGLVAIKVSSHLFGMMGIENETSASMVQFNSTSFGFATALVMATILLSAINFEQEDESSSYSDDDGAPVVDDESKNYANLYLAILWLIILFLSLLLSYFYKLDTKKSEENSANYAKIIVENSHSLTGNLLSSGDINSSFDVDRISASMDAIGEASGSRGGGSRGDILQDDGYKKMCSVFLGTLTAYLYFLLITSVASDESTTNSSRAMNIFLALIILFVNVLLCAGRMSISVYKRYFEIRNSADKESCWSSAGDIWRDITTKNVDFHLQMYRIIVAFMMEETLVRVYIEITADSTPSIILAAVATLVMLVSFNLIEYYSEQKEKNEKKERESRYVIERSSSVIL